MVDKSNVSDTDDKFWSDLGQTHRKDEKTPPPRFSADTRAVDIQLTEHEEMKEETYRIPPREQASPSTFEEAAKEIRSRHADPAGHGIALASAGLTGAMHADAVRPDSRERLRRARDIIASITVPVDGRAARVATPSPRPSQSRSPRPAAQSQHPVCYDMPDSLITHVEVRPWPSGYTFYERFRTDAAAFHKLHGTETPYVRFFSYMPQYHQLSEQQRAYYLWWRDNIRAGRCITADMSYVLLYLYEIINLPELIKPQEGVAAMCLLWRGYGRSLPKLGRYIAEWLCDYCLINRLPAPHEQLAPLGEAVLSDASFREFYIRLEGAPSCPVTEELIRVLSLYDWRTSKFITPENEKFFEKHINGALRAAFAAAENDPRLRISADRLPLVTRSRDAYSGSLCACDVKRRIDVTFRSVTGAHEARPMVTELVKYTENQLRGLLAIKPRFAVKGLPDALKTAVTAYFAPYRAELRRRRTDAAAAEREASVPEYEKLYEAQHSELSPERAREIENAAWRTTETLVSAFDETDAPEAHAEPSVLPSSSQPSPTTADEGETTVQTADSDKLSLARAAVSALLKKDRASFTAIAKGSGMMPETLAEIVNDAAFDIVGDIAVGQNDGGYGIIEDYRKEMEAFADGE